MVEARSGQQQQQRQRLHVTGVVQGVGFRPFVYGLAHQLGLSGFVGNDSSGVFIEVEGDAAALDEFQVRLRAEKPPLAHIETIDVTDIAVRKNGDLAVNGDFAIIHSQRHADSATLISPDLSICDDCLRELFDPADPRYHYPFINCTNCGPRFTIITDIPYDRPLTTMSEFAMCPSCEAEYHDPRNRRFHAQPNACPDCGPRVEFVWQTDRDSLGGDEALARARQWLRAGKVVAVKGIGGFHLACDATDRYAVQRLRERKGRPDKPFALMVRDLDIVRRFAEINDEEAALLTSRERPIVLLRQKRDHRLSPQVAPRQNTVGVMLPYSPLHYLLLDDTPLVMTSGNLSDEPIITDNDDALDKLAPIADAFLLHDREIHVPCDDSVLRVIAGHESPVRRSRGYAPFPVRLPLSLPPTLAVGGELKSTFCLTRDNYAFMSQHIGDMENLETLDAFAHAVEHFTKLFRARPERVVCDLHPRYLSAQWARQYAERESLPLVEVQHHHAHIAAVLAENGYVGDDPVIGISMDGTGYGTDGAVWGGEFLLATYHGFERAAHLSYMPLPGGDSAVKKPYRLALAYLHAAGLDWTDDLPPVAPTRQTERDVLRQQLDRDINVVSTSSIGRLFDVIAALTGLCLTSTYEGQAAMELEAAASTRLLNRTDSYRFGLTHVNDGSPLQIDSTPLLTAVVNDVRHGVDRGIIAARFHDAVADMMVSVALSLSAQHGIKQVALSGGVFQNARLLEQVTTQLDEHDFTVYRHRQVPANDGGLALGQAIIGGQK